MEEGPYLGLIQIAGFGDMEIIARHVLSPEELPEDSALPRKRLYALSFAGRSGRRGGRSPEHPVQGHQVSRVEYPS